MADLVQGRLARFILVAVIAFSGAALFVKAPHLILISNALLLSVSSGVVVAYAPVVATALAERHPTRGDYLGLGIFLSWLAQLALRVMSITARDFGWPEIVNTHWASATIDLSLLGALLHLWAPNAVEGRLPRERWVSIGIVVSIGVGVVVVLWSLRVPMVTAPAGFRPL